MPIANQLFIHCKPGIKNRTITQAWKVGALRNQIVNYVSSSKQLYLKMILDHLPENIYLKLKTLCTSYLEM
jgi:hypothetical protein